MTDGALSDFLPSNLRESGAVATLKFEEPLDDRDLARLRASGLTFERRDSALLHVGPIYQAFVPWSAFEDLRDYPGLVRVESTWSPSMVPPLETTADMTGADRVRRRPELGYDGEGVLLGDIDSGFDIFHPSLFRADGGYYAWKDVDGDGVFDPETDGVDLDQDGEIEDNERLRVLDAAVFERGGIRHRNGTLEPSRDWLYVDRNQNGERDIGPESFDERTPAYAEPTFVVDDADEDGELDPDERLVRLNTSKFKRVVQGDAVYERGDNLIELGPPTDEDRSFHGTGATSVMVGGHPGFHDRIGLAPGADVVGYAYSGTSDSGDLSNGNATRQLEYVEDAIQTGVDVLLHEWTRIVFAPLDGSTNLEAALKRARNREAMTQINPLGNLNRSQKHLEHTIAPDTSSEMTFVVDEGVTRRGRTYPYRIAYGALQWQSDQMPTFELTGPDGQSIDLTENVGRSSIGEMGLYVRTDETTRGTNILLFVLRNRGGRVTQGQWTIRVSDVQTRDDIHARIADRYSSWGVGIRWSNPTRGEGTMVFPSTADAAFGVAAFAGNETRRGRAPGELRKYSGRGPRIDGARGADIAAPDDPLVAFGVGPRYTRRGVPHSWFRRFGGTSGASPHVAAAAALLAEQHPQWGPDQIESRLANQADDTGLSPDLGVLPNSDWGHGKLNIFRAVTGQTRADAGEAPEARLDLNEEDGRLVLDASTSSDPDGDALEYRFDYDYNGTWDTPWQSKSRAAVSTERFGEATTVYASRLAVRDERGRRDGAVDSITDLPPSLPNGDAGTGPADAGLADTGDPRRDTGSDMPRSTDVAPGMSDVGPEAAPSPNDVAEASSMGADARASNGSDSRDDRSGRGGCSGCSTSPSIPPFSGGLMAFVLGIVVWRRRS